MTVLERAAARILSSRCFEFSELSAKQLYSILAARQIVFVVEQNCPYLDCDGVDLVSRHLVAWEEDSKGEDDFVIAGYLRIVPPGEKYVEPSIGRFITTPEHRGTGLGRRLFKEAVEKTIALYPDEGIRISAQAHLAKLYSEYGFQTVTEPYLEDGIPHVEMLRR